MMADGSDVGRTGTIQDVGILDLTGMKSPEELAGIQTIQDVGVILVPEPLMQALTRIKVQDIGSTIAIPEGENVRVHTGQVKLTGEALASPVGDDEVLVVAGQLHITTPVSQVGFGKLIVVGQIFAPRGSEDALATGITQLIGQVIYYPEGARFFYGKDWFGKAFFEFLDGPTALVLVGKFTVDREVPVELLREKVSEIVLVGKLQTSRELAPILQILTTEKQGEIVARKR
jgi:hypothetical protein